MSFQAIRTSLLFLLGVTTTETPPAAAAQDAADALNGALQTLWLAGEDYFTREKVIVAVTAGNGIVALDSTVQNVLAPIYDTVAGQAVRILSTRTEYDLYPQVYQRPGSADTMPPGPPRACYVERLRGATATAPVTINLWLRPLPAADTTLAVQASRRPIAYNAAQFAPGASATAPDPLIPDAYVETLLLPIARALLISSRYFSDTGKADAFRADAQRALAQLGTADPAPAPVVTGDLRTQASAAARGAARTAYQKVMAGGDTR